MIKWFSSTLDGAVHLLHKPGSTTLQQLIHTIIFNTGPLQLLDSWKQSYSSSCQIYNHLLVKKSSAIVVKLKFSRKQKRAGCLCAL